jgi:DNA-binding NarL/FixJ family response regulator
MARLLLCEDDARFRRLLINALSSWPELEVVGEAGSGEEACSLLRRVDADLLLLDLELPGIDGVEVARRATAQQPGLEVVVLTNFRDEDRLFSALSAGASGYLVKGVALRRLRQAIVETLLGGSVIDAGLGRRFWNLFAASHGRSHGRHDLTAEEVEVLSMVARGLSNPEAAQAAGLTRRSVKAHLESVYRKLGVSGRVEAVVHALRSGIISLSDEGEGGGSHFPGA